MGQSDPLFGLSFFVLLFPFLFEKYVLPPEWPGMCEMGAGVICDKDSIAIVYENNVFAPHNSFGGCIAAEWA